MTLEESLKRLHIAVDSTKGVHDASDLFEIRMKENGNIEIHSNQIRKRKTKDIKDLENSLTFLFKYDKDIEQRINSFPHTQEIESLRSQTSKIIHDLRYLHAHSIKESEVLSNISLIISSFKIGDLLRMENDKVTEGQINKIIEIYYQVLQVLQSHNTSSSSVLLSKCSFILPLLIVISLALRLGLSSSTNSILMKILTVLMVYHLKHPSLFHDVELLLNLSPDPQSPSFTSSSEPSQALVTSLWEKIIGIVPSNELNLKSHQGPISLINNLDLLSDQSINESLISQILIPHHANSYLPQLSSSLRNIYPLIYALKLNSENESKVSQILSQLITHSHSDFDVEVMKILLKTLNFEMGFLSLRKYNSVFPFHLFLLNRLGTITSIKTASEFNQDLEFLTATLDSQILRSFDKSRLACYRVLFELIDHNLKLNITTDFQLSLLLERSLISIFNNFDITEDHSAVSDLGSMFSLEGVLGHSLFVMNLSLLKCINPKKKLPSLITSMFDLKRFPPVPKSKFLDFESLFELNKSCLNLRGFERLCLSSNLCCGVILRLLKTLKIQKKNQGMISGLESSNLNLDYRSTDILLLLYYELMFVHLVVSNEFIALSKKNLEFSSFEAQGNIMRLQVFEIFEVLFGIYGSFASFKLISFISEISMRDLKLKEMGFKLLHHLVFHGDFGFKNHILEVELIKKPVVDFILLWNNGGAEYNDFCRLLSLNESDSSSISVLFDSKVYLRILGYIQDAPAVTSPVASTNKSHTLSIDSTHSSLVDSPVASHIQTPLTTAGFSDNGQQYKYTMPTPYNLPSVSLAGSDPNFNVLNNNNHQFQYNSNLNNTNNNPFSSNDSGCQANTSHYQGNFNNKAGSSFSNQTGYRKMVSSSQPFIPHESSNTNQLNRANSGTGFSSRMNLQRGMSTPSLQTSTAVPSSTTSSDGHYYNNHNHNNFSTLNSKQKHQGQYNNKINYNAAGTHYQGSVDQGMGGSLSGHWE